MQHSPQYDPTISGVSVLMPVFNQKDFIRCAIESLMAQTYTDWELVIIDDGSTDGLKDRIEDLVSNDRRIRFIRNDRNRGIGYSLNRGIQNSIYETVSYLPADDIIFPNHLSLLVETMRKNGSDLVYSGVRYKDDDISGEGQYSEVRDEVDDKWLQLVQVLHKKTDDRWMERKELATDDLGKMFWDKFIDNNPKVAATGKITCEWVSHTYQRHRIMNDRSAGGLYMYRTHYGVKEPVRYKSASGNYTDEISHYDHFRYTPVKKDKGLKILIVGELSYNPERLCCFERHGHKLFGLWIPNPFCWNPVGPLPFGNIETLNLDNWEERVKEIKPDIIYALLNYKAVDLAYHVFKKCRNIPFVWHFKEGPFYCRNLGLWSKLMELISGSEGTIYINDFAREWYHQFMDRPNLHELVLDGDLPPMEWFKGERSQLLSDIDGEAHTFVAGRLFGLGARDIEGLAANRIHLHIYGDIYQNQAKAVIEEAIALVPEYVHLHPSCPSEHWVEEFSRYDAGWLHWHRSENFGLTNRAQWPDFNSPARMSTYAIAGVPMIMFDNSGHRVHYQEYLTKLGMAIPIKKFKDLSETLFNKKVMDGLRENAWRNRMEFAFDTHFPELEKFFYDIVENNRSARL